MCTGKVMGIEKYWAMKHLSLWAEATSTVNTEDSSVAERMHSIAACLLTLGHIYGMYSCQRNQSQTKCDSPFHIPSCSLKLKCVLFLKLLQSYWVTLLWFPVPTMKSNEILVYMEFTSGRSIAFYTLLHSWMQTIMMRISRKLIRTSHSLYV